MAISNYFEDYYDDLSNYLDEDDLKKKEIANLALSLAKAQSAADLAETKKKKKPAEVLSSLLAGEPSAYAFGASERTPELQEMNRSGHVWTNADLQKLYPEMFQPKEEKKQLSDEDVMLSLFMQDPEMAIKYKQLKKKNYRDFGYGQMIDEEGNIIKVPVKPSEREDYLEQKNKQEEYRKTVEKYNNEIADINQQYLKEQAKYLGDDEAMMKLLDIRDRAIQNVVDRYKSVIPFEQNEVNKDNPFLKKKDIQINEEGTQEKTGILNKLKQMQIQERTPEKNIIDEFLSRVLPNYNASEEKTTVAKEATTPDIFNPLKHIANIPKYYQEEINRNLNLMKQAVNQPSISNILMGGLGALGYISSPISAAIRGLVSEPTREIGREAYRMTSGQRNVPEYVERSMDLPLNLAENALWALPVGNVIKSMTTPEGLKIAEKLGITPKQMQNIINEASESGLPKARLMNAETALPPNLRQPLMEDESLSNLLRGITSDDLQMFNRKMDIERALPPNLRQPLMQDEMLDNLLKGITSDALRMSNRKMKVETALPPNLRQPLTQDEMLDNLLKGITPESLSMSNRKMIPEIAQQPQIRQPLMEDETLSNLLRGITPDVLQMSNRKMRIERALPPNLRQPQNPEITLSSLGTQNIWEKLFKPSNKDAFIKPSGEMKKDIASKIDDFVGVISTRLRNISPELAGRMRRYVWDEIKGTHDDLYKIKPFYEKFQKLPENEQLHLTMLARNGNLGELENIFKMKGMLDDYKQSKKTIDALFYRAQKAGLESGTVANYLPSRVRDYEGLKKYLGEDVKNMIERSIDDMQVKAGRLLDNDEKANIINNILKGYDPARINLAKPIFARERVYDELSKEMAKHYYPLHESMKQYVQSMNSAIAKYNLFGKTFADKSATMGVFNDEKSIGSLIQQLRTQGKRFTPDEEQQLKDILKGVLNPKKTSPSTSFIKDLTYGTTLTNPIPAITQIQDLALSTVKYGLPDVIKGLTKSTIGKIGNKLAGKDISNAITTKDLYVDEIAHELTESKSPLKWVLEKGLKYSGFNALDRLGKETIVNSALSNFQKLAQKNPVKIQEIAKPLGLDAKSLINDLRSGKKTDDVMFLLFNELSDLQPISKLEVPLKYLTTDFGKTLYALKTYQIKLLDVYRSQIYNEIKKGNVAEGLKRLMKLGSSLVILGAGTDKAKDYILGRKTELPDLVVDNILKLGGMSKYNTWLLRKEGLVRSIANQAMPSLGLSYDVARDLNKIYNQNFEHGIKRYNAKQRGYETVKDIPLVGKPAYYWFGEGERKEKIKRMKEMKGAD